MNKIDWKLLEPQDIDVRPQFLGQGKTDKVALLLYQNCRTAQDAFDAQFGEFGWSCEYRAVGDQIYGRISVKDPQTGEWVYKEDTGSESNIEKEKGLASDIFKRVAVKWGFARELYTAPKIIVDNDGYNCSGYKVSKISYDQNRRITALEIVNRFGKVVWATENKISENKGNSEPKVGAQSVKDTFKEWVKAKKTQLLARNDQYELGELEQFFNHYWNGRLDIWSGNIYPERLWNTWIAQARR